MSMARDKVVCVTGASGYIASWLVKFLLLRGYTVHAIVRDLNNASKVRHLMKLEGAKERLELFEADLLDEGSFDAAVSGCDGVFHTASPVLSIFNDPQVDVLDPAVKGTLNVLNSCRKVPSVRRIVLTSSMAAVVHTGVSLAPDILVDESWFSNPEFCKKLEKWYQLSKTSAEIAAWNFVKENGMDMVCINPGVFIGPMLQPILNQSVAFILNCIKGTCEDKTFAWVDVKDVATAHILAFEVPSAHGRYCLSEAVARFSEIVEMLRELYPTLKLPDKRAVEEPCVTSYLVSKEKAENLGLKFTPFKASLADTVENLKENGFVTF